jgi:hypothetical protein
MFLHTGETYESMLGVWVFLSVSHLGQTFIFKRLYKHMTAILNAVKRQAYGLAFVNG